MKIIFFQSKINFVTLELGFAFKLRVYQIWKRFGFWQNLEHVEQKVKDSTFA